MRRWLWLALVVAGCGDNVETMCPHGAPVLAAPLPIEQLPWVAHEFGSPSGLLATEHYTESREAFDASYRNGFRAMEIDLITLGDGTVVGAHDEHEDEYGLDRKFKEITRADMEGRKWKGKYPVLFAEDLIQIMVDHPDIYLILDTKWDDEIIDRRMVELAPDDGVRDRLVPHVVSDAQAAALPTFYPFPEEMIARYRWDGSDTQVQQRMVQYGIDNVMMWWNWRWNEPMQEAMDAAGYHVWVHTPEDPAQIDTFIARGVGVYSDGYIQCDP